MLRQRIGLEVIGRLAPKTQLVFGGALAFGGYHAASTKQSLLWLTENSSSTAQCCGIVGYIGSKDVEPILSEGIRILQNRGYDSCGIATLDNDGEIITTKYASQGSTSDCIDILAREAPARHGGHRIGIAHTRWATHGGKTDTNAHPHSDHRNRISLVHNGTIENYAGLKQELKANNIEFRSDTDTEVVANLIGHHLDKGENVIDAVTNAVRRLQGTWGLVVMSQSDPGKLVLARNGSPLLIGSTDSDVFVASEPAALARHTNQFLSLLDGEICVVTSAGIDHLTTASRRLQSIKVDSVEVSPDPFPHWTIKEICEQPQSLSRALNYGGRISPVGNRVKLGGLDVNESYLCSIDHLLLSGCGTSLYAAMYGERLMQFLSCLNTVTSIDASELHTGVFPADKAGLLLLSQSGETLDTIRACQLADSLNVRKISIVNAVGSSLARMTNCGVYLNAGREVAVASTKAFTSQVVVLSLVATWFAQHREHHDAARTQRVIDTISQLSDGKEFQPPSFKGLNSINRSPVTPTQSGPTTTASTPGASQPGSRPTSTVGHVGGIQSSPRWQQQDVAFAALGTCTGTDLWSLQARPDRCQTLMDAIHRVPVCAGMTLSVRDKCREIALKIKDAHTLFVLGKGFSYPVALEAALKLKEIAYVHAEGFPGGALKHGPFALIDENDRTPIILIIPRDEHVALMLNAAEQVRARGARLICVVDSPTTLGSLEEAADVIVVPSNGPLTALMCAIALQLLAYELAIAKNLNPDKPRGLAKTVTVS